jgi:hypothetical protein
LAMITFFLNHAAFEVCSHKENKKKIETHDWNLKG